MTQSHFDAMLHSFRDLADAMAGPTPRDWEWCGSHMSQRMFGITRARAEEYAKRHGGIARRTPQIVQFSNTQDPQKW